MSESPSDAPRLPAVVELVDPLDPIDAGDLRDIWRALAQAAKNGDVRAAEVVRRWLRVRRRRLRLDLAPIHDLAGAARAQAELFALAAAGEITAREARDFSAMVENRRRAIEILEWEPQLHALNAANAENERQKRNRPPR
ncbi:MAG: hypothetical protein JSS04_20465 [Proteobacteria bacterium]|nr:hypothetical protein [Pseudomonadota bacterium]